MTIRRMTAADVQQAAQIERETFSRPWSAQAFADAVEDDNALFLVAEESLANTCGDVAQAVVGYIGMYVSVPEGEITNVAVASALRGCGYGRELVHAMQKEARELGVDQIFLEVRDSNEAAIHVYTAAGFEEIGKRRGFYELPREDARVMRWNRLC